MAPHEGRNGSSLGFGEPDSYSLPPPGVRRTFQVPTEGRVRGAGEDAVGRRKEKEGAAPGRERRPGPGGSWRWHGLPACHQAPQLLEIGGSILWGVNRLFEDRSVAQTMQLLTRCRLLPGAPGSEAPPDGESWRPDAGPGWEEASESARWPVPSPLGREVPLGLEGGSGAWGLRVWACCRLYLQTRHLGGEQGPFWSSGCHP